MKLAQPTQKRSTGNTRSIPSIRSTPLAPGWTKLNTPFGPLLLGFTKNGLAALAMTHVTSDTAAQNDLLHASAGRVDWADNPNALQSTLDWLADYAAGRRPKTTPPLDLAGTEFQRRVWSELLEIPLGQTRSYHDIARAIGQPAATRAVGTAVGANPVAIIVPCHRVLRADGSLGGFRWDPKMKTRLLDHEASHALTENS